MRSYTGQAPFACATVVLRRSDATWPLLKVASYFPPNEANGVTLSEDEWAILLESQQALELPTLLPATINGGLWLFRPSFGNTRRESVLEELRQSGAQIGQAIPGQGDVIVCFVDQRRGNPLRGRWSTRAFDEAFQAAQNGHLEHAIQHADRSFVLDRGLVARHLALLAILYEKAGLRSEGESYTEMARRTKGQELYEGIRRHMDVYRAILA